MPAVYQHQLVSASNLDTAAAAGVCTPMRSTHDARGDDALSHVRFLHRHAPTHTHTRDGKNDGSDTHTDIIKVNVAA